MYGIIYKVTNLVNGKIYIGQTAQDMNKRRKEHESDARNRSKTPFHRALNKYGFNNFLWEVIDESKTFDELRKKEIYWIKKLKTYIHEDCSMGYNCTLGGDGTGFGEINPRYGKEGTFKGKKHTEETKEKMKRNHADFSGKNHPNYGKCVIPDNILQRYKEKRGTEIAQLDLDGNLIKFWISAKEAERQLGFSRSHIGKCCKNIYAKNKNIYKGFKWIYADEYETLNKIQ